MNDKNTKRRKTTTDIFEHGKLPPQAVDLEETVLGGLLLENEAFEAVIDRLLPEHFYKEAHAKIYNACQTLYRNKQPVDIRTVTNQLKITKELEIVGGPYYVTQLTNSVASAAHIDFHISIIIQKYLARELIRTSTMAIKNAYDDSTDIFDLLDFSEGEISRLNSSVVTGKVSHISEYTEQSITQVNKRRELYALNQYHGINTGLVELNHILGGWQTNLYVLAARPSMGKSAAALFFAKQAAKCDKVVKMYSLEMTGVRLSDRLILSETNLDIKRFRSGHITQSDILVFAEAKREIDKLPIYVDDRSGLYIDEILRDAKAFKNRNQLDMVIVDHCGLVESEQNSTRNNEIGDITKKCKKLSKDLDIPVFALFQLSRDLEKRGGDKRPGLPDLRDSGNIEQDADIAIFIYRPEYYGIMYDDKGYESYKNYGEFLIKKNRDGELGTARFNHNTGLTKLYDYEFKPYLADCKLTSNSGMVDLPDERPIDI